ncbi:hypothetical protein NGRA_0811 [Nosema granulosis]|uniref:Uncharacterized protein n=1 Tax=Nosema granulosis TaxID=83296 RepID=A0A9P6H0P4_9MICR|nr:hypothetical protein NGRA_0811 [Nosema granulosis]
MTKGGFSMKRIKNTLYDRNMFGVSLADEQGQHMIGTPIGHQHLFHPKRYKTIKGQTSEYKVYERGLFNTTTKRGYMGASGNLNSQNHNGLLRVVCPNKVKQVRVTEDESEDSISIPETTQGREHNEDYNWCLLASMNVLRNNVKIIDHDGNDIKKSNINKNNFIGEDESFKEHLEEIPQPTYEYRIFKYKRNIDTCENINIRRDDVINQHQFENIREGGINKLERMELQRESKRLRRKAEEGVVYKQANGFETHHTANLFKIVKQNDGSSNYNEDLHSEVDLKAYEFYNRQHFGVSKKRCPVVNQRGEYRKVGQLEKLRQNKKTVVRHSLEFPHKHVYDILGVSSNMCYTRLRDESLYFIYKAYNMMDTILYSSFLSKLSEFNFINILFGYKIFKSYTQCPSAERVSSDLLYLVSCLIASKYLDDKHVINSWVPEKLVVLNKLEIKILSALRYTIELDVYNLYDIMNEIFPPR